MLCLGFVVCLSRVCGSANNTLKDKKCTKILCAIGYAILIAKLLIYKYITVSYLDWRKGFIIWGLWYTEYLYIIHYICYPWLLFTKNVIKTYAWWKKFFVSMESFPKPFLNFENLLPLCLLNKNWNDHKEWIMIG